MRLTVSLSSSGFSAVSASYDGRLSTGESAASGIIRFAPEVSFSKLYLVRVIGLGVGFGLGSGSGSRLGLGLGLWLGLGLGRLGLGPGFEPTLYRKALS